MLTENGNPMTAERHAEIARILADLGPIDRETWFVELRGPALELTISPQFTRRYHNLYMLGVATQADCALAEFLGEAPFAVAELLVKINAMRQTLKDIHHIATSRRWDACPTPAYVQAIGDLAWPFLVEDSNATR